MKAFFFQKILFIKFCNLKIFWFCCKKNLPIKVEKTFSRNNIILDAFYCKFATFTDFEKKTFFQNNTTFVPIWEILPYQTHSTANLL